MFHITHKKLFSRSLFLLKSKTLVCRPTELMEKEQFCKSFFGIFNVLEHPFLYGQIPVSAVEFLVRQCETPLHTVFLNIDQSIWCRYFKTLSLNHPQHIWSKLTIKTPERRHWRRVGQQSFQVINHSPVKIDSTRSNILKILETRFPYKKVWYEFLFSQQPMFLRTHNY